jgi:carotenoid cleavage dioxygenase-like enzyme
VLFPILPLQGDLERARAGGPAFAWRPELGGHLALLPRKGHAGDLRCFEAPPCYVFHVLNAWEDESGRRLHADVMRYDRAPLFPTPDGTMAEPASARLVRWSLDLGARAGTVAETALGDVRGEFPRIDERHAGLPYRHGWACRDRLGERKQACAGIVHVDLREGRPSTFWGQPGERFSEPVFVARGPGAPEGDGWLLALVHRPASNTSDLLVFEATALERGPLATVHLSHRVPAGFHGSWVGASR